LRDPTTKSIGSFWIEEFTYLSQPEALMIMKLKRRLNSLDRRVLQAHGVLILISTERSDTMDSASIGSYRLAKTAADLIT
jgi:hypothetical protein